MRVNTWRLFDRVLAGVIIAMFLSFGVFGYFQQRRTDELARQGAQAHDAICVFRADLERRVETTKRYLDTHPDGFAGVPVETIQKSLTDQERTIRSLASIKCGPTAAGPAVSVGSPRVEAFAYADVLNCSDFKTSFPTPPGDPNHLDGDHDGVACEANSR